MSATGMAREAALHAMQRPPKSRPPNPAEVTQSEDDTSIVSDDDSEFVPHWVFEMVKIFFSHPPIPIPTSVSQSMFISQLTSEILGSLKVALKEDGPKAAYAQLEEQMLDWIDPFRIKPSGVRTSGASFTSTTLQELKTIPTKQGVLTVKPSSTSAPRVAAISYNSMNLPTELTEVPCKSHLLGACPSGSACPFSHEIARTERSICKYFLEGKCKLGAICESAHVLPNDLWHNHEAPGDKMPQKYDIPTKVAGVSQRQSEREGPVMQTAIDFEYRGNPKKEHENSSHSFASYYSAQSSLVGNASLASRYSSGFRYPAFGISRRNTSSFQQSPTYYSAESSLALDTEKGVKEDPVKTTSGYLKAIQERGLILPLDQELNWSGKENGGQHVEFNKGDALPFEVIGPIGTSLTAQVDKIRCRRILLARKTMICGRRMTLEEALVEVEHLQKLRHPHIVQLVGSYLQGKKFSVLLYPVADYELTVFLDEVLDIVQETPDMKERAAKGNRTVRAGALFVGPAPQAIAAMWSFFGCLVDAVRYIHSTARKHLDIKPGNILVRKHPQATYGYRIYIADFGISRSFKYLDHSQTDTHIRRTPKYCAPEVWEQDVHGRAADIFSLGCVFMEMLTILCWRDLDDFADFRSGDGEGRGAYHESIDRIFEWAEQLRLELEGYFMYESLFQTYGSSVSLVPKIQGVDATLQMLARESEKRKLPIFNRGEPASDGCHTCGEVPETYEYEAEV